MKVYHGSNQNFDSISSDFFKDKRDFGRGFYTTTLETQAGDWAVKLYERFGGDSFVYEFEYNENNGLSIRCFGEMNEEWLKFIAENRIRGGVQHHFDIVSGPVADDRTNETIGLYLAGTLTADIALQMLRYFLPNNQISFHTERALAALTLIKKYQWNT